MGETRDTPAGTSAVSFRNRADPQARPLLDRMAQGLAAATVEAARAAYLAARPLAGPPEPVATEERAFPGPSGPVPVRLYRPAAGTLPVVLFFHGGKFMLGDLDTHDAPVRALANRSGCLMVSVAYRLAPEHPYPAGLEDCWAAMAWAAVEAPGFGGDPDRLAVAGDSAGGNLAAVVARRSRDRGRPRLCRQVLIYPNTDAAMSAPSWHEFHDDPVIGRREGEAMYTAYAPAGVDRLQPEISPLRATDLSGLPPALVVTGECDPLRDEGESYADRLAEAGVPVARVRYPGMIHGFVQYGGALDAGRRALDEIGADLRTHLRGQIEPLPGGEKGPKA